MKNKRNVKVLISIIIVLAIILIYLQLNCTSLEKYISKKFPNIVIHKVDYDNNLVLFSESYMQSNAVILSRYRNYAGYFFDLFDENGWSTTDPYFLEVSYRKGLGNIVVVSFNKEEKIKRVEIEFINSNKKFKQEFTIEDNTYFEYITKDLLYEDFSKNYWQYHIIAYDEKDNVVIEHVCDLFVNSINF